MSAELLIAHFNRISEAPEAVSRLRRFILDLSVRGRLVEQNSNDEPASAILARIRAEKTRLVEEGVIKKLDLTASPTAANVSFPMPSGWTVATLQSLCISVTDGDHIPPPKTDKGIPFLVIGNVRNRSLNFAGCRHVSEKYYEALDTARRPQRGDILYTLVGSYGIPVTITDDRQFCVQRHIGILRPSLLIDIRFLSRVLESKWVLDQATASATGIAQKTVPLAGLRQILIPLPPVAEQYRIAVKVDELMALCDRLEAAQRERETRRTRLMSASNHHLNNGASAEEFRDHANFYLRHISSLTTRPHLIRQLRQTVLNLAFRGRLVPQNSDDESASALFKRIQTKKAQLRAGGKIRVPVPSPVISAEAVPFRLPGNWLWVRFGELVEDADAGWSPKSEDFPKSGDNWGVLKVSAVSWDRFLPEENKQLFPGVVPPISAQVHAGNFLISRANTSELVAKSVVVEEEPRNLILSDKIVRLQTSEDCDKTFLSMVNNHAPYARAYYAEEASGTSFSMKNVSRAVIYGLAIPLPPHAEQRRIMAKVKELIALCDYLEAEVDTIQEDTRRLLESVLHHALKEPEGEVVPQEAATVVAAVSSLR